MSGSQSKSPQTDLVLQGLIKYVFGLDANNVTDFFFVLTYVCVFPTTFTVGHVFSPGSTPPPPPPTLSIIAVEDGCL